MIWEEILTRFPLIEVVGEPRRVLSSFVKGYETCRCACTPDAAAAFVLLIRDCGPLADQRQRTGPGA